MNKDMVRIGVIGTGFGVRVQIPVWSQTPGARVAAVCSSDMSRAEKVAERFGITHAVTSPMALASLSDVDLVSVATPPYLHREGVMAAIEAGKDVLCEKPFALNAGEGLEMLERARRRGVIHFLNYEFRTIPSRIEMRRRIRQGDIGTLMHVHVVAFGDSARATEGRLSPWWYDAASGGGRLGAAGSHTIDALRFIFGEIAGVSAQLETYLKEVRVLGGETIRPDADDTFMMLFRFAEGAMGAYLSGAAIAAGGPGGMRIEAYGTQGTLALEGDRLFAAHKGERVLQPVQTEILELPPGMHDPHYAAFAEWARQIVAAVRERRLIEPNFVDGWRSQQIIDAARLSQAQGRWVEIPA